MRSNLTRTAARIYGTLSGLGHDQTDVLGRLLPFFDPILRPKQGQCFSVEDFAREVREEYKWNFNSDVVEVFLPRLVEVGWLTADDPRISPTTYHITLPPLENDDPVETTASQELRSLAIEFKEFSENLSPLTVIPREIEEFEEILIEWLLYIEAFSEKNIAFSTRIEKTQEGKMRHVVDVPRTTDLSSEERFLCARYVSHAIQSNPDTGEKLARIAAIGLLTEVVQDFVKPIAPVEASNLVVYLDAPVAMELLGLSGKAARENTEPVINELKRIGVQVRIFGQSVDEIRRNLTAVLKSPTPTGPTAQALARNEVMRDFVIQASLDPETALSQSGIGVNYRTLDQYPNEHQYCPQDTWDEIYSALNFQQHDDARAHDADLITLVMRQRRGFESSDIFKSRFIAITRNGLLAQIARKKCIETGLASRNVTPPVVHRRYLTASIWLRTGLAMENFDVPKRLLLANCERVLAIKPGVVGAVKKLTEELDDPEKTRQLELLVSQHRSAQALMDKTLGSTSVVTAENLSELFDEMIHPHLEEERSRGKEAVKEERRKKKNALDQLEAQLDQERALHRSTLSEIESREKEDLEAIEALFRDVGLRLGSIRRNRKFLGLILAFLLCVPIIFDQSNFATWLSALVAVILGYLTITGNKIIGTSSPTPLAMKMLEEEGTRRGLSSKISRLKIDWNGAVFSIRNKERP